MRAHYLQHVPFEGIGFMKPWLDAAGCEITHTRLYESAAFPSLDALDLLIIMGGPMSVNDEAALPWLKAEKQFVKSAIEAGKSVLGVCLGAQMIASAMGARVYPNRVKEIGWHPVMATDTTGHDVFRFPRTTNVFHWHGETFDLPSGAVRLARSEACENQAFQLGSSVIGLQFHLESTPECARKLVENCRAELRPVTRYVQSEIDILMTDPDRYRGANVLMGEILAYLQTAFVKSSR